MTKDKEKIVFYLQFKNKREDLEKTLSDIATSTKINIRYLEAIEKGDFDVLPNVYIRLFLRTYSEVLELNTEKILNEYSEHVNISNQQLKTSGVTYIKKKSDKKNIISDIKKPLLETKNRKINNGEMTLTGNYFISPKKIFLLFLTIISISAIYMSIYYLANKQRELYANESNNIVKQYNKEILLDLNANVNLKIINNAPTRMKISYKDSAGNLEILCNDDIDKPVYKYEYEINEDDVYFQIFNVKHISEISINESPIINLLDKEDDEIYLIDAHINRPSNSLEIIFYNK